MEPRTIEESGEEVRDSGSSISYTCLGCHQPISEGFVFVGSYRVDGHEPSPIFCHSNSNAMYDLLIKEQLTLGTCPYMLRQDLSIMDLEGRIIHSSDLEKVLSEKEDLTVNEPNLAYFTPEGNEQRLSLISRRTRRASSSINRR